MLINTLYLRNRSKQIEEMGISHCTVVRKRLNILQSYVPQQSGSFQNNHAEWVLYHKTPWCYPQQSNWIKSRQRLIYSALYSSLCLTRLVSTLCSCTLPQKKMKSCHVVEVFPCPSQTAGSPWTITNSTRISSHACHAPAHRSITNFPAAGE